MYFYFNIPMKICFKYNTSMCSLCLWCIICIDPSNCSPQFYEFVMWMRRRRANVTKNIVFPN